MTRDDLSAGYQSVQPAHALAHFAIDYKDVFEVWQTNHKNLIVLSVQDEDALHALWLQAKSMGIKTSAFLEPDIGNEMTAIAMEPSEKTYEITKDLKLALREELMLQEV